MNYKEFLYLMSKDVLEGLDIPKFVKNIAINKMNAYFEDNNNDMDLEMIFLKIMKNLKDVKYP